MVPNLTRSVSSALVRVLSFVGFNVVVEKSIKRLGLQWERSVLPTDYSFCGLQLQVKLARLEQSGSLLGFHLFNVSKVARYKKPGGVKPF